MARKVELAILFIITSTVLIVYCLNLLVLNLDVVQNPPLHSAWIIHGIRNVLGYSTVFLPGFIIYKYVKRTNYLNVSGRGPFGAVIRTCFGEDDLPSVNPSGLDSTKVPRTQLETVTLLLFYFFGLQVSYLSWGVLQEKVMTQKYTSSTSEGAYFKDSQFLVFVNRILAFVMAAVVIFCSRQPRHKCPLYKYVFCSFSNIMSSWCQYEALKYVSFPSQVLAKASKTIPVMIMGKVVSKTKYEFYEYVTAFILSIGMLCFLLDTGEDKGNNATAFSGVILLCAYIAFDSFTSNWQQKLFKVYEVQPIQMMCFVNFFSCIFTFCSLLQHGGLLESFKFMFAYPSFILDIIVLSICSASGQMFIFRTIDEFGPLVFVIISTIRQCFSVLLSCIIYGHKVNLLGVVGLFLVFFSVLLKVYCGYRIKKIRQQNAALLKG